MAKKNSYKLGFTLVELAIVLVIIGLITGGVLGANSLIKSAERQEIIKVMGNYNTAIRAFQLEYDALPGDFNEAEDYWGASDTDNGNGNKLIDTDAESIDAWNHLGLAEIVNGTYDHTATTLTKGTSTPLTTKLNLSIVNFCGVLGGCSGTWSAPKLGNKIVIMVVADGGVIGNDFSGDDFSGANFELTNLEAKKLDKKIDDGDPLEGTFLAPICSTYSGHTTTDRTFDSDTHELNYEDISSPYFLSNEDRGCSFFQTL